MQLRTIKTILIFFILISLTNIALCKDLTANLNNNPDFWIQKTANPEQILMTSDEIKAFNDKTLQKLDFIYDLSSYQEKASAEEVSRQINSMQVSQTALFYRGKHLTPQYLKKLLDYRNLPEAKEIEVKYALTLRRTNLRTLPTREGIFETPKDKEFDMLQETAVDPAQPVIILNTTKDGKWHFVQTYNCRGWLPSEDTAYFKSKDDFTDFLNTTEFFVTNSKVVKIRGILFQLGAKIPVLKDNFSGSYFALIPCKDKNGFIKFILTSLHSEKNLNKGYLEYSKSNIINQAFKMYGQRYGWGGMFNATDCSGFILNIFNSFGFIFPRNSSQQEQLPFKSIDVSSLNPEEKKEILRNTQAGAILFMPGHVMLYLGENEGRFYIIHALASMGEKNPKNPKGTIKRIKINKVTVSDLEIYRKSGKTFLESLTLIMQTGE